MSVKIRQQGKMVVSLQDFLAGEPVTYGGFDYQPRQLRYDSASCILHTTGKKDTASLHNMDVAGATRAYWNLTRELRRPPALDREESARAAKSRR